MDDADPDRLAAPSCAAPTAVSDEAALTWAPAAGSVAEGTYRWTLEATDGWGNGPLLDEGTVTVDLTSPDAVVAEAEDVVPVFSPNGDGTGDSVGFTVGANEPGTVVTTVRNQAERDRGSGVHVARLLDDGDRLGRSRR